MGKVSFSSMVELEKKKERGELLVCLRRGKERGRTLGEVEGSVGPDGGAWRGFSARTTRRQRHARTVREGGTDRPSVPHRNNSPFSKS
jgi:hypothetical protein